MDNLVQPSWLKFELSLVSITSLLVLFVTDSIKVSKDDYKLTTTSLRISNQ